MSRSYSGTISAQPGPQTEFLKVVRGPWNEDLFRVLEGFPDLAHDDEVDVCSDALEMLNRPMEGEGIFGLYRRRAKKLQGCATPT
jgi:hypothetical protein